MRGLTEEHSRRLDPRLRVIRNGDANVNQIRSEISTTVASQGELARKAPVQEPEQALEPNLTQDMTATEPAAPGMFDKSNLGKRPKLKSQPAAHNSYVNVFIELAPERTFGHSNETAAAEKTISAIKKNSQKASGNKNRIKTAYLRRRNLVLATIPVDQIKNLEMSPGIAFVHRSEPLKLDIPKPTAANKGPPAKNVGSKSVHKNGEGIIIGIIDVGGFDFSHQDFTDPSGNTRFLAIWDQGGDFRSPPISHGFDYGAEFLRTHLNAAIKDSKAAKLPPTELERQSQREPGSHATHVTSIAAGNKGVCPKADIVAVLIDIPTIGDERAERQFTFSDSSRIIHAVEYLLAIAKKENKPISINISLGTNGGAHDGSSGTSRWLDALLATPGRAISLAAGNAGQEKSETPEDMGWIMGRIHTSGQIRQKGLETDLEWTVVGNGIGDISENELEIWFGCQDRFSVSVQPPGSAEWITVGPREYVENHRLSSGTTLSIYNELYHPTNGSNYISIYLSPNLSRDNLRPVQAGVWRVRIRGDEIRDGRFHAWIERDDPYEIGRIEETRLFRFPSFFSQKSNVDSHSISSLACGHRVIAVANADLANLKINISSSQGPTRDDRMKPEIAAPGTEIVAANGFDTAANAWVTMTGTSMASPYVAGVVGLMLAAKPSLTSAQCAAILQRTSRPLPGTTYDWKNDSGFGMIDPEQAVLEASTFNKRIEKRP